MDDERSEALGRYKVAEDFFSGLEQEAEKASRSIPIPRGNDRAQYLVTANLATGKLNEIKKCLPEICNQGIPIIDLEGLEVATFAIERVNRPGPAIRYDSNTYYCIARACEAASVVTREHR